MKADVPLLDGGAPEAASVALRGRDPREAFFTLVGGLIRPTDVVVDFGAGRGNARTVDLRGRCIKVIGLDVDPAVESNPNLTEAHVVVAGEPFPLPDASVDLVYAYATVEHVEDAQAAVDEIHRVLKPGGWFCAWTPNKWSYVGIAARLMPRALQEKLAKAADPGRPADAKTLPTFYRFNTLGDVARLFAAPRFEDRAFAFADAPAYTFNIKPLARLLLAYGLMVPAALRQSLYIFARKSPVPALA